MASSELNPTEYISHHLTHGATQLGDGGFWTLHFDSVAVSILLGFLGMGFIWWVARGATAGVPGRRQAFVEWLMMFVDDQAKGIFRHGDRSKFVAPTALTVFVWVLLMNAMDFLPVDWVALGTHHVSEREKRGRWTLCPRALLALPTIQSPTARRKLPSEAPWLW